MSRSELLFVTLRLLVTCRLRGDSVTLDCRAQSGELQIHSFHFVMNNGPKCTYLGDETRDRVHLHARELSQRPSEPSENQHCRSANFSRRLGYSRSTFRNE